MRDPAIKLFGKTIPLMENGPCCSSGLDPDPLTEPAAEDAQLGLQDICTEMTSDETKDTEMEAPRENHQGEQNSLSSLSKFDETEARTSSQDDVVDNVDSKSQQDQSQADASGQEKVLKKPDKILPCPRCKSLDTKFCYFNNYNVNQPRHFCKNCQRYWTAGGTMRNVPVGAGRRKNKQSSSHYRHIWLSPEELAAAAARGEATESTNHQAQGGHVATKPLKENGAVLKFGLEVPLCESMSSVLNLGDKKKPESGAEEPSCASSATAANCSVETNELPENVAPKEPNGMHGYCNGPNPFHPMMQCYPGPPWAYPWSPGWSHVAVAAAAVMAAGCTSSEHVNGSDKGNVGPMQWIPPPVLASPAFCAPPIPIPFMPPAFWPTGSCTMPWSSPNSGLSPLSSTSNSGCSGNGSPKLGKHYREAYLLSEEKTEKSLWVPKTLRIDDPDEAVKSSIWATLGIKPDECGIFKPFQSKAESKGQISDAPEALHANPAALSRSQSFQEAALCRNGNAPRTQLFLCMSDRGYPRASSRLLPPFESDKEKGRPVADMDVVSKSANWVSSGSSG